MRMKLYQADIVRADGLAHAHINAPTGEAATRFVKDYHDAIGIAVNRISVSRVDDRLAGEDRQGLEIMLDTAPVGFASWCEPIGWFVHEILPQHLKLYGITCDGTDPVLVVAPNPDVAAAVWCANLDTDDGLVPLWTIADGMPGLNEQQRIAMAALLEFGPVGVVTWDDESGWSISR